MAIPFPTSGSYLPRAGNLVQPLVDGGPAYRRICNAARTARHSIWLTVTFFAHDFQMPDAQGSLFDVLDRAVSQGLDVRVIFWRPNPESSGYGRTFPGTAEDREMLRARGSRFRIRWDRADGPYCQHQKSWIIDAGQSSETSFVGGINMTAKAVGTPGHIGEDERHDLYVEVTGPSATDIHHNFVQRWNEASERSEDDGSWGHDGDDDLAFPTRISDARGESLVQIQRNVHPGRYRDGHASPGAAPFAIAGGEKTILEQYCLAIDAARQTIYIENQATSTAVVADRLEAALRRGVIVVMLVPAVPETHLRAARRSSDRLAVFAPVEALGGYENFMLVGIAAPDGLGGRRSVYVHAKIMLIDDAWATIGSCNLHAYSLSGHTEMNASFADPDVVRTLRARLLSEHLAEDTALLDDVAAIDVYRRIAEDNARKGMANGFDWQGLAFRLDPREYGA